MQTIKTVKFVMRFTTGNPKMCVTGLESTRSERNTRSHSPHPWKLSSRPRRFMKVVSAADGSTVADIHSHGWDDAVLIANAPELLAAARAYLATGRKTDREALRRILERCV